MLDVINLALPFFGLIFIGFVCGKLRQIPDAGLAWMNFFILYVALPALFFHILSKTPFEQLAQLDFIKATTTATATAFAIAFIAGLIFRRKVADATLAAVGGGFGNVGYMGPGLALATFGQEAAVPVALVFSFDALLVFALVPILMAFGGASRAGVLRALLEGLRSIALNPLLIAAALGVLAAAYRLEAPVAVDRLLQFLYVSAAPCALFALGVTVALRPVGGLSAEIPILAVIKLAIHPTIVFALLPLFGTFDPVWIGTAVLLAALPPALTAYVFARHYDRWIEQASSLVLVGTLVSVATLTVVMWLVKSGTLLNLSFL